MLTLIVALLDRPVQWANLLEQVLALTVLVLIGCTTFLIAKVREHIFNFIVDRLRKSSRLRPATAHGHKAVKTMLEGMLEDTGAFRVSLFQFHNGDVYAMSNHSWKASCTHEVLSHGAAPTLRTHQSILVSAIPDWVGPVTADDYTSTGVDRMPLPIAEKGRRALYADVAAMETSVARIMCEDVGANYVVLVNLTERKTSSTFGYISLQFQHTPDRAKLTSKLSDIVEDAKRIEIYLCSDFHLVGN